jgi:leader peptidase (prepilin peptidase)/N-methyltransferase
LTGPLLHLRIERPDGGSRLIADLPPGLAAIIASPFVGSVLGVLIRRLPAGQPVALDRSRCESCGHALGPLDLVPVASYLALRGRCRFCGAPIAPFHLAVELAAAGIAAVTAMVAPDDAALWCGCALGWALLALAWIDWRHMILPDALTLPLVLLGLGATVWRHPDAVTAHAAAAALAYLLLRLIAWTYRRLRGRDGLGEGDAKLMAAAGAWVGIAALSSVLLGGALVTLVMAVVAGIRSGTGLNGETRIPLGPGLCAALWVVWLAGLA